MACGYDEDINENPFYRLLSTMYRNAFEKSVQEGWIICVPRRDSFPEEPMADDDVLCHVLIADQNDCDSFTTLTHRKVRRIGESLLVLSQPDHAEVVKTRILFEETCYSQHMHKYTVFCIEIPIQSSIAPTQEESEDNRSEVHNINECLSFLWSVIKDHKALNAVNRCCSNFSHQLDSDNVLSVDDLSRRTRSFYANTLTVFGERAGLKARYASNCAFAGKVNLAIETYIMYLLHGKLMEKLLSFTTSDDAAINKVIQNVQDLQPRDLGINSELASYITPASHQMTKLARQNHPLGKYITMKRVVQELSGELTAQDETGVQRPLLTSDDLLPMFILVVIRAGVSNWTAQLILLKYFHLSATSSSLDEYGFLVATLEAAVEHIRSGVLIGSSVPEADQQYTADTLDDAPLLSMMSSPQSGMAGKPCSVRQWFKLVARDDVDAMLTVLDRSDDDCAEDSPLPRSLCHPLCVCPRCQQLRDAQTLSRQRRVSLQSRDADGRSALHVAARHGAVGCLEALIGRCDSLDDVDFGGLTAVHHAAQSGQQAALLLLLNAGAAADRRDQQLARTPLHLAANNGHQAAVATLLYWAEQTAESSLSVSAPDLRGDTPLHLAARFGYERIGRLLIEHDAAIGVQNRRRQTPLDTAHDPRLRLELQRLQRRHRQQAPTRLLRLMTFSASPATDSHSSATTSPSPTTAAATERSVRRLFAAITAADERLACFYLGIDFETGAATAEVAADRLSVMVRDPQSQETPLHAAVSARLPALTRLLLVNGARVQARCGHDSATPLHRACSAGFAVGVLALLAHGADVNSLDSAARSPLHCACAGGRVACAERLLRAGADPHLRDADGNAPIDCALTDRRELLRLIQEQASLAV